MKKAAKDIDTFNCGLCGLLVAPKARYRRFLASMDGILMYRAGHVECIKIMGDAPPEQMWEEEFAARTEQLRTVTKTVPQ